MIYYTVEQMAEMMQVHVETIRNYIKDGRLGAFKIGKEYRITEKTCLIMLKSTERGLRMTSKTKKYYWLKLKDDFFNSREIKKLRRIAGGDTYTIIYLKNAATKY